jgi:hypothetical protein
MLKKVSTTIFMMSSKTEVQFNERTFETYGQEGLDPPRGILAVKARYEKFKSKFKEDKGPLQIVIKSMHRRPKIIFDKTGKAIKKDFLTYTTEYIGHDWLGNEMRVIDNIEGVFTKPRMKVTTKLDPETGNHIPKKEYDGEVEEYYIELTDKNRKQVIQDIINKSNGSTIENIIFYGHFPGSIKGPPFRCDQFTYDQFINSSFGELETLARKGGGPQGNAPRPSKEGKPYLG